MNLFRWTLFVALTTSSVVSGRCEASAARLAIAGDWPDPAVWQDSDGETYSVATGLETVRRSRDLFTWEDLGRNPLTPAARRRFSDFTSQRPWAPNVVRVGKAWLLYVSLFKDLAHCRIEVLESDSPIGPFSPVGTVIDSADIGITCTIDSHVVSDDGRLWMFFGSYPDGVHLIELASDGKSVKPGAQPHHVAGSRRGSSHRAACEYEGAYAFRRGKWWYLFLSSGSFNSWTYHLVVGRSERIEGPYLDRDGNDLLQTDAPALLASRQYDRINSPGHNGDIICDGGGRTYMYYHAHAVPVPGSADGPYVNRSMFVQRLDWDDAGWPFFAGGRPMASEIQDARTQVLVVGGNEAACAAAVQAARLGDSVLLVSDIDMLGGQFSAEGVGPVDERIKLNGHSVNFPRSGMALEIIEEIERYNRMRYGVSCPGNCWSATDTIEPGAAAEIFERFVGGEVASGRLRILRGCVPVSVGRSGNAVSGVRFRDRTGAEFKVDADITIDASDWGDIIRMSGAGWFAGVDPVSRFHEQGEPETVDVFGRQEMTPITWTMTLRETDRESPIPKPDGYDRRNYTGGIFEDFGVLPETYPADIPATAYSQRRLVDARNLKLKAGARDLIQLNTTEMDYPLCDLPKPVCAALEKTEPGASAKNIVEMSPEQREIVFADARRRALGYLYFLQNDYPPATNVMRRMALVDDFRTADRLPPKPYVREGLRLDALTVVTANDVKAADEASVGWAPSCPPDAAFGFQFHIDFHPTRRKWVDDDRTAWRPQHAQGRSWNLYTHRSFFPLSGFVPKTVDGLLGAGKNIGMSSIVAAALRLHPQMLLSGQCAATLAAECVHAKRTPRGLVTDAEAVRRIQRILVSGVGGKPGVAICAWQDLRPFDVRFLKAHDQMLNGRMPKGSVFEYSR